MTQLSRPYQIALVTLALLVLVWFAALRHRAPSSGGGSGSSPAASSAPATPSAAAEAKAAAAPTHIYHGAAPGVEGLTRAIDKAHGAVAQSQHEAHSLETAKASTSSASAAHASHTPTTATGTPAHSAPVTPTHVHASPPAAKHVSALPSMQATVEHELQQGRTVLILFWNRHGSDDVAVHNSLPAVQHALGTKVTVHYATAAQVGAFGTITHAVQVTQTPTLLIVNPHGQTMVLTGLNDAFAIQQAVAESRRS